MWLMTPYGFISAVHKIEHQNGEPTGDDWIAVRSRDLKSVQHVCDTLGITHEDIVDGEGTDYRYRVYVQRDELAAYMVYLADTLDYDNFKNKAAEVHGKGSRFVKFLTSVWWSGVELDPSSPLLDYYKKRYGK